MLKHHISLKKVETEKWTIIFSFFSFSYKCGKFAGKNDNFYEEIQLKIVHLIKEININPHIPTNTCPFNEKLRVILSL